MNIDTNILEWNILDFDEGSIKYTSIPEPEDTEFDDLTILRFDDSSFEVGHSDFSAFR